MAKQTAGRPIPPVPTGPLGGRPTGQTPPASPAGARPTPAHGQGHNGPGGGSGK
jgi:hypothetical protein